MTAAQQEQVLRLEVGAAHLLLLAPGVLGRQGHQEGFVVEGEGKEARLLHRGGDDHGVQFAPTQFFGEDPGVVLLQQERHTRGTAVHLRDQLRQQIGGDGVDAAQAEGAVQLVPGGGGHILDAVHQLEDARRLLGHPLAGRGDRDLAAATSLEQHHAQFLLQLLDGHRQGGLGNEAGLGGTAEVALAGNGEDVFQFGQGHG